ncbi:MAG: DNA polymerase III subunit alpha [Actinomycetota bacterium]|nr:DNA polymerase III subunit alpha [Actinomycetota bacterium]
MGSSFTHLHNHTEFSMLDGAARVGDVVARAVADGQPAIGITDHGNMYGVLDFYKAARAQGVKPIIGTEAYMAAESRFDRPVRRGRLDDGGGDGDGGEKLYYHLTLLAETNAGYKNLLKLSSDAYLEGYFYKPRCLVPGQEIVTRNGMKPIEEVREGDEVLTHRGRFRKVQHTTSRQHVGEIYGVRLNAAYDRVTWMTGEHPVLIRDRFGNRSWTEARCIRPGRNTREDSLNTWNSWVCLPTVARRRGGRTSHPGPLVDVMLDEHFGPHRKTVSDEFVYKPVTAIEVKQYDGPVYNIEVEEDHSYVSDFAMHNCDWDMLDQYHEGVIATTGCLGGVVLQALLKNETDKATKLAARLQDVFGRDSMFVELQDHGLAAQRQTNPQLIDIAKRIKAPLLATNDGHYTRREDAIAHDALLCVQTGSTMDDPKRFKFEGDEHYLKSAAEMRHLFADYPEACDNTLWIAERADVTIEFGKPQLPSFPRPTGFADADAYLRHLAYDGAASRYGSPLPAKVDDRLSHELGIISSMGFSDYFLVVWDLIRYARDHKIRVGPGRGSAAGCCVAYCLQIVDLDPIAYDLLFERFLNPGRKQMPDIDMDFDERYRSDMIRYAAERYGWDHVAQIVTFSTIKARAAVRDAARVLGYPYGLGDRVAKAIPPLVMGRDTPLWACFEQAPKYADGYRTATELRDMYAADPDVAKVVDVAKGLEGLRRQDGIHAAAVVISADPLTEYLPIQRKPVAGGKAEDAPIVTQYEMHGVEELGLLKMDFLGLRNLSVIERSLDLIEASTGERPDIDNVDLHDDAVFEMLQRGDSIGVFQLEGTAMRALMRSLAPTEFEDVAALVALYRPGPMAANMHYDYADRKNGRKPVEYLHPDAEEVLGETYGLCLAGDTVVHDARTGLPVRLDQVDPTSGITVQAVDDDLRPVKRVITDWRCNGERDTIRLRLRNGMTLTGTPDHRVLTEQGWKEMGSLVPSDHVGVPRQTLGPDVSVPDDLDRLRVLGNLLADGSLSTRSAVINWIAVESVEPVGRQWVYDITVDDVHNFVANGIIAHNCIYQESMMRVAQKFAGYSLTEADNLRKAAGKKVREIMALERQKFIDGCERTGYGRELGARWMDIIEPFADYAFNRSHAFGYGYISYQTAWLKAHHPAEYFAALLTSVREDKDKTGMYLAECRAQGIEVLVPDINLSSSEFTALRGGGVNAKGSIPFGMSAIRNVGSGLVERLVAERDRGGRFVDFYDFANRVDPVVLNKRTVESLVKAGAFDSLGYPRQGLCLVFEQIIERTLARRREEDQGVMSLFESLGQANDGGFDDARLPIPEREFDKTQRLAFEKEMLGLYVSDHPLLGVEAALARHTDLSIAELLENREGSGIRWVGGVVTGLARKYTRKGDLMATFVLEDLQSSIEVWVFPRTMSEIGYLLADDVVVCVKARLDTKEDQAKLICMEIKRPALTVDGGADALHLELPMHALSDDRVDHLRQALADHPGGSPVFLHVGTKCIRLGPEHNVDTTNGLVAELRVLLGEGCLWNKPVLSA